MNSTEPMDELLFIKKIMSDSSRILVEDGSSLIFWGILIVIGQLSTYAVVTFHMFYEFFPWLWPVLVFFGFVYSFIYEYKKCKKQKVNTFAGKILGALWFSVGITALILGFVPALTGAITHSAFINPLISTVLGIAYFVSGQLYGKKWVTLLAIGWWLGSIFMFVFPYNSSLLVMSAMMICLQLIPGFYLRSQYNKNRVI